jgi:sugar O-acyltransferase (sialic acid O-acetyltransferase NeuD family)
MKSIYIFSAAGFGRELYGVALRAGFKVKGFVEKELEYMWNGVPVISEDNFFKNYIPEAVVVAVGDPHLREKIVNKIVDNFPNCEFPNIIDPTSILLVPETILLGKGIVIMPFCYLTTGIIIRNFCQFNVGTGIGHDCIIEEYVTTGMNPNIAGNNKIGRSTRIGSNVTTKEKISICNNVMLGIGTVVVKDITRSGVYIGNPAKKLIKDIVNGHSRLSC